MHEVALVGLVDGRGWLLMQERDDQAQMDPDKWGLVGGSVEPGELPDQAAARELTEETGLREDLEFLDTFVMPCSLDGEVDHFSVYTARTTASDADVVCTEGRQIVFVAPDAIGQLDLSDSARAIYPAVLAAHSGGAPPTVKE